QVFRTELQGGTTSLVAVGKYLDEIQLGSDGALLVQREVRLDTRMLGKGYHVPF
ncbi:methanesulfonate monooxygenase, partial [Pseudomonas sp. GW460-13]